MTVCRSTYHFRGLEARDGVEHALAKCLCVLAAILLLQLGRDELQVVHAAGDTEPLDLLRLVRVCLAVDAEVCVVLALDQPVAPLLAVDAPGLHREGNVGVEAVLGGARLVCVGDHRLDDFVLVERPEAERVEERDLAQLATGSSTPPFYLRAPLQS
jgi:hypothetical protein